MVTLRDYPKNERPRERLVKYGAEALSLQELLALIFGRGIKGEPVMSLSQKLLSRFGSLRMIEEASIEDLKTINGLGLAKACQIKACFELARRLDSEQAEITSALPKQRQSKSFWKELRHYVGGRLESRREKFVTPKEVFQVVRSKIVNYYKEHLVVVSLDNRNKIIGVDTVSIGTLNSSLIHPRETFEIAIKRHAGQIILCHNHPSGELTPSEDDIKVTKNLISAGNILGIKVIDHLIITKNDFYSFAENRLLI